MFAKMASSFKLCQRWAWLMRYKNVLNNVQHIHMQHVICQSRIFDIIWNLHYIIVHNPVSDIIYCHHIWIKRVIHICVSCIHFIETVFEYEIHYLMNCWFKTKPHLWYMCIYIYIIYIYMHSSIVSINVYNTNAWSTIYIAQLKHSNWVNND